MKRVLILLLFITTIQVSYSQRMVIKNLSNYDKKFLHFGFTLGLNKMDFVVKHADEFYYNPLIYGIETIENTGFHLGPVSNFRLGNYLDLRFLIDLSFGQRDMQYRQLNMIDSVTSDGIITKTMQIESIFIECPLLLKYKAKRIGNYRPYVIAGLNPRYDLSARKEIKEEEKPKIKLKSTDFYVETGIGLDYYFPYFKFSTELKYSFGMLDVLQKDNTPYTSTIKKLNSRVVMLSFHFE